MTRLTDRLLNVRKRRALGWAALAYAGVVLAGALVGRTSPCAVRRAG